MDKIIYKDPADLRLHRLFKSRHDGWSSEEPRFLQLCDSVRDNGVRQALFITAANEVVDGRHRFHAARRSQLDSIPCVVVPDDQVMQIVLDTLIHRRHLTPVQRAFAAVDSGLLDAAFDESRRRMSAGRKVVSTAKTVDDWARELGVSYDSITQARRIFKYFADHPEPMEFNDEAEPLTLEDYYVPRIMDEADPMGLGAAIAGIGFKLAHGERGTHKGGAPKEADKQLDLFKGGFNTLSSRWAYWQNFTEPQRDEVRRTIRTTLETAPEELLKAMERDIETELKKRKKQ